MDKHIHKILTNTRKLSSFIVRFFYRHVLFIAFFYSYLEGAQVGRVFEFDLAGNLKKTITDDQSSIFYEYNELQQLSKVTDSEGKTFQYQYDANGNCTQIEDEHGITKYEYDLSNRLMSASSPKLAPMEYSYDHRGRLQRILYPGGVNVSYGYDAADRLTTVKFLENTVEYIYDQTNNVLSKIIFPNSITTEYEYDKAKRIIAVFHRRSDNTLIAGFRYKFDRNGNRIYVEQLTQGRSRVTEYSYDKLNRLINVKYPGGYERYTYDALGNRLTKNTPYSLTKYEYDQYNRLVKAGDCQFFYDMRGNLIKKTDKTNKIEYTYDAHDNLITYRDAEYEISYTYDAEGRRLSKTVNGEKTLYVNDAHSPVAQVVIEAQKNQNIKAFYVYGLSRLCQFHLATQTFQFYLYDYPDRNVTAIVDMNQQVCNYYSYEAFGSIKSSICTTLNHFTFAGENYEKETKLIYLRNRYYDPETGRFLSPDPRLGKKLNPQSFNPYTYVENNPLNFIDPLGLKSAQFCAYPPGTITENTKSAFGHGFWILTKDNGDVVTIGRYPEGTRSTDKIVAGTVAFTVPATDAQISAILNSVDQGKYWGIIGNCIDGLERGLKILGIEHPSFRLLGVSVPTKAVIWIESLNGKNDFQRAMEQDLKLATETDAYWPSTRPTPLVMKPECPYSAEPAGDLGGISLNTTAQILGSLSDIVGATYDFSTGQLILMGTQNYSLPPMDFDDLAVAVRSVYGLGDKPPQSPGVSIDWNSENNKKIEKNKLDHLYPMLVRYEGVTEGTRFGQIMFEADRVLKCLSLGKDNITGHSFKANVRKYKSLPERYSNPSIELELGVTTRMWIAPKEIRLVKSADGSSIFFDHIQMEVLTEAFKEHKHKENEGAEDFAAHFTAHFDEFAKQYPILEELKRLGKITGIVKWLKENNIPIDLSLFTYYIPKSLPTTSKTPALVTHYIKYDRSLPLIGGVSYHLSESNFHEACGNIPNSLDKDAIRSRPSENIMEWDINQPWGNSLKAVAHTIERTRKTGNIQKFFIDMRFPVSGEYTLELVRYYNSFNHRDCGLGVGWEVSPASLHFPRQRNKIRWEPINVTRDIFPEIFVFEQGKNYCFKLQGLDSQAMPIYRSEGNTSFIIEQDDGYFTLHKEMGTLLFDPLGKLTQKIDRQGKKLFFSYDNDRLINITHQNGQQLNLEYQNGRIVCARAPGEKTLYYQCNENGQLHSVTDQLGTITVYGYDVEGNLNAIYDAKNRPVFEAVYDHYHRAISVINGKVTTNQKFDLKEHTTKIKGPNNIEIFSQYDTDYRLLQTRDSLGRQIECSYQNGSFQPIWTKDVGNNEVQYLYDVKGNICSIKNKAGIEWKFWYDSSDRLIAFLDGRGRTQIYEYDEKGRLKRFLPCVFLTDENPITGRISYEYSIAEAMEYEYDLETGAVSTIKKGDELTKKISYDTEGRIAEISDPYGYTIRRTYDARSRLKTCADLDGGFEYEYNERDQVIKVSSPVSYMIYEYDEVGNIIRIKDGNGNDTHLEYDENYDLIAILDAEGGITRYKYNDFHCLTQINLPNGSLREIIYDDLNRPIKEIIGK